jgi:hypothetical protein
MPFPLALLLALALVVANDCASHWLAPAAILLTPLVLLSITALLASAAASARGREHGPVDMPPRCGDYPVRKRRPRCRRPGFIKLFLVIGLLAAHQLQGRLGRRVSGASPRQQRWALWAGPLLVGSYLLFFRR